MSEEEVRKKIRQSNRGELKLFLFDTFPLLYGSAMSGAMRLMGGSSMESIAITSSFMPIYDLAHNEDLKRNIPRYLEVFLGATLPHADKIYSTTQKYTPQIFDTLQSFI